MVDLWPESISKLDTRPPVRILREQAALLGSKTNNVVEAEVKDVSNVWWADAGNFAFNFYIIAPLLKGYRYRLLGIAYPLEMYPMKAHLDDDVKQEISQIEPNFSLSTNTGLIYIESENEFQRLLGAIFKSEKVMKLIGAIMAQSEGE